MTEENLEPHRKKTTAAEPESTNSSHAYAQSPKQFGQSSVHTIPGSQSYDVQIAGIPMKLKSSHDEMAVRELVSVVDRKIHEALPLTKSGSIQNAAILASLHLAEEQLLLKKQALIEIDRLEKELRSVLKDLQGFRSPNAS